VDHNGNLEFMDLNQLILTDRDLTKILIRQHKKLDRLSNQMNSKITKSSKALKEAVLYQQEASHTQ
jgi:hypothetical protein